MKSWCLGTCLAELQVTTHLIFIIILNFVRRSWELFQIWSRRIFAHIPSNNKNSNVEVTPLLKEFKWWNCKVHDSHLSPCKIDCYWLFIKSFFGHQLNMFQIILYRTCSKLYVFLTYRLRNICSVTLSGHWLRSTWWEWWVLTLSDQHFLTCYKHTHVK